MKVNKIIKYKYLLITNIILKALDVISTYIVLKIGGQEANPFVAGMMEKFGIIEALLSVFIIYSIMMVYLSAKSRKGLLIFGIVFMSIVVISNSITMIILL